MIPLLLLVACTHAPQPRAYRGHAVDMDSRALVRAWPQVAGTRLDDCRTCHAGWEGPEGPVDACDSCHLVGKEGGPASVSDTLNPFGTAYLQAGRSTEALHILEDIDPDGDGHATLAEVEALRFPGDPHSHPGTPVAPSERFDRARLQGLPMVQSFLLVNHHTQPGDDYTWFEGVRLVDLLEAAGVDPMREDLQSVTVFSVDGFARTLPAEWFRKAWPQPPAVMGRSEADLGECGHVRYSPRIPEQPADVWVNLAWIREGEPLEAATLSVESGSLDGQGPYRLVVPQLEPGQPDRGQSISPTECGDGFDYDDSADHNAGHMARALVAIRVDPAPEGFEAPDHLGSGWRLVEEQAVVVYGLGVGD